MQNDRYTDFDLELKRMLQDAEEEAPSRVWDAVSSELDRRDRRKVVALRWRRAAVGVAAAAAVLSGIFVFLGRGSDIEPAIVADSSLTQSNDVLPAAEEVIPDIEDQIAAAGAALADVPAAAARPVRAGSIPAETVPTEVVPADAAAPAFEESAAGAQEESASEPEAAVQEQPEQPVAAPRQEAVPAEADNRRAITGTPEDPFAWPEEAEEGRSGSRPSFTVAGNALTNDFSGTDIRQMRAPSAAVKNRTGVEDKGSSNFDIPLTVGLGVRFGLTDRLYLGTGLNWSKLSRTFNGIYTEVDGSGNVTRNISSEIVNDIHYVGIPLNLYYNIFDTRSVRFYAWGGGTAEKGVTNRFRIKSDSGDIFYKEGVDGIQWSAGAGLGLEFLLGEHFGLYFDPSVRYYFDCGQPVSIRTKRPLLMNYEIGVRFNL